MSTNDRRRDESNLVSLFLFAQGVVKICATKNAKDEPRLLPTSQSLAEPTILYDANFISHLADRLDRYERETERRFERRKSGLEGCLERPARRKSRPD